MKWLKECWSAYGLWGAVMSFLVVLPLWQFVRNQKTISEAALGSLLPFSAEASAEASDSEFGLSQARRNHAVILDLYIRSLDKHDISSVLNIGRPSQLRTKLISIKKDLESKEAEQDPANAIHQAAERIYELYIEFQAPLLGLPTLKQPRDGAALVAVSAFSTTADLYEHTMNLKDASSSRKTELCELACLDSRRAFLVLLCQWHNEMEREKVSEQFTRWQEKTLKLTELLAKQISETQPAKAKTLEEYAKSMVRRLQTIQAMNAGNHAEVIRILNKSIQQSHAASS